MLAGVIAAQSLSFWLTMYERDKATIAVTAFATKNGTVIAAIAATIPTTSSVCAGHDA